MQHCNITCRDPASINRVRQQRNPPALSCLRTGRRYSARPCRSVSACSLYPPCWQVRRYLFFRDRARPQGRACMHAHQPCAPHAQSLAAPGLHTVPHAQWQALQGYKRVRRRSRSCSRKRESGMARRQRRRSTCVSREVRTSAHACGFVGLVVRGARSCFTVHRTALSVHTRPPWDAIGPRESAHLRRDPPTSAPGPAHICAGTSSLAGPDGTIGFGAGRGKVSETTPSKVGTPGVSGEPLDAPGSAERFSNAEGS